MTRLALLKSTLSANVLGAAPGKLPSVATWQAIKYLPPMPSHKSTLSTNDLLNSHPFAFYIKKHRRLFSLGVGSLLLTNAFDVVTPLLMQRAIDQIAGKAPVRDLFHTCVYFFCALLGLAIFRYYWRIFFGGFHHSVADDLRQRIYGKLTKLGPSFFQKNPVGELMQLVSNDVNSFRMGIGPGTLILFDGIFLTLFILPFMIYLSWDWTWRVLIFLPLIPFVIQKVEKLIHISFTTQQEKFSLVSGRAQEMISGIRLIKSYAQEEPQLRQFNALSSELELAGNKVAMVDSTFQPLMEFMVGVGSVVLLWVASPPVIRNEISIGTLVAFQQYIQKLVWPMAALGASVSMIQQGMASYDRIHTLLKTESDVPDHGSIDIQKFESLKVINLSFTYPDANYEALRNINFQINAGESLGIIGPIGSGKTTLIQLLCRLWPIQSGAILLNDIPISEIKRSSLSELVSVVPQEPFLFSDTVTENIAYGLSHPFENDEIVGVSQTVNIQNEIESMPHSFDSNLGERGVNLSGGQKQRLTIARAIVRDSQLYIFDDSLSAVDHTTEKKIVKALETLTHKEQGHRPAVIIVSHRLASLKHTDRIIVMNRGQIEAIGTHRTLLQTNDTYKEIARLQNETLESEVSVF